VHARDFVVGPDAQLALDTSKRAALDGRDCDAPALAVALALGGARAGGTRGAWDGEPRARGDAAQNKLEDDDGLSALADPAPGHCIACIGHDCVLMRRNGLGKSVYTAA
jgi:hypothetical protein